jgi:ABC-2 type transport system ATP-binding protein
MAGIYTPSEGSITVTGTLTPFIELGVGFSPELTGKENIFLNAALLGFNRNQTEAMYKDIVEFAELERFMDQKLKNYSTGMQVRLAFSIAIRAQSDILLIDEVLAVGDSAFQAKCFDYFYELKNAKKTVIFVSHDMSSIQRFCDRAVSIDNGKLISIGDTQDVVDDYAVAVFKQKAKTKIENSTKSDVVIAESLEVLNNKIFTSRDTVTIRMKYKLIKKYDIQLRFAIFKDGTSFAHVDSGQSKLESRPGQYYADFTISLKNLLEGEHEIYWGIFGTDDSTELAFQPKAAAFYIKGQVADRHGVFRLEGEWTKFSRVQKEST